MTRDELQVLCDGYALIYNKADADSVMDAMEQRINVLNAEYDLLKSASHQKIESLEKQLEDVQNTMATENTDLGMENHKLKERIKELEASQPKWISVDDDEKPKEDEEILFTDGEFIYKGCWTTWDGGCSDFSYVVGSGFVDEVNDESLTEEQITHWMPIPQPPKSEKSTEVIKENLITEQTNKSED